MAVSWALTVSLALLLVVALKARARELHTDWNALHETEVLRQTGRDESPWTDATAPEIVFPFRLPYDIKPRFLPGEYWIGLFVRGGWDEDGEDNEADVAFDYFHSPQLPPLTAQTANTTTTALGSLKQP